MQEIGTNSKHPEITHGPDDMAPGDRKRRRKPRSPDSSLIQFAQRGTTMKDLTNTCLESNDEVKDISRWEYGKHTEEHVDGRRTKNFEKRARHKMKDAATKGQKSKPPKKDKATNKATKKRKKNGEIAPRNKSDALIEGYSAENIANQRITVRTYSDDEILQILICCGHSYNRLINWGFSETAGHLHQRNGKDVGFVQSPWSEFY
jgi:hypothetical protein